MRKEVENELAGRENSYWSFEDGGEDWLANLVGFRQFWLLKSYKFQVVKGCEKTIKRSRLNRKIIIHAWMDTPKLKRIRKKLSITSTQEIAN